MLMQLGTASSALGKLSTARKRGDRRARWLIHWHSRADDLIPEESDTVLLALKRLPPKEAYDRVFRLRRAFQVLEITIEEQNRVMVTNRYP